MKKEHIVELPYLYDAGGNLSKDWHVVYRYLNPKKGKMERFRITEGLSKLRAEHLKLFSADQIELLRNDRYKKAEELVQHWTDKLKSGYNPFKDGRYLYVEDLPKGFIRKKTGDIERYLQEAHKAICNGLAPKTISGYKNYLNNFIEWIDKAKLTNLPITDFDFSLAERFLIAFESKGQSNKHRNEHMSYIRQCFSKLMKLYPRKIIANPFATAEKKKHKRKKSPIYRTAMRNRVRELLSNHDHQLWLFVQFIYYTGLRPHVELRQIQLKEIDLMAGTLLVTADKAKDDTDRIVTIPVQLHEELLKLKLHTFNQEYYLFTIKRCPGPKACCESYFGRHWKKFRVKFDIPEEFKIYAWKHTGASAADESGIDRREIKGQLGHSSLQQTEEYLEEWENNHSPAIRENYPTL